MFDFLQEDFPFLLRATVGVFAAIGGLFIVYGVVAEWTGEKYGPLERSADTFAAVITLIGTALTAVSIYPSGSTPAENISKHFTAPLLIFVCVLALFLLYRGWRLSPIVLNGFAILAIAAALFRLQPNPYMKQPSHDQVRSEASSAAGKE